MDQPESSKRTGGETGVLGVGVDVDGVTGELTAGGGVEVVEVVEVVEGVETSTLAGFCFFGLGLRTSAGRAAVSPSVVWPATPEATSSG
jgi:hypothetical protein